MKVAVWGAGNVGTGLVRRLAVCPFVSELVWLNRSVEKIEKTVTDVFHGLSFAPTCRSVQAVPQARAERYLPDTDLLVLTLGGRVRPGATRADLYKTNAAILRKVAEPVVKARFYGIVLIITNPVDLMARLMYQEASVDWRQILGLGTVVETARLRSSIGDHLSPARPARNVWAYAVGTHDKNFVPVLMPHPAVGTALSDPKRQRILRLAKQETVKGAERVKHEAGSSVHPVVEGAVAVAKAIGNDSHEVLTVSCLDPSTRDDGLLFYSMPCALGRRGIVKRYVIQDASIQSQLDDNISALRAQINELPEDR